MKKKLLAILLLSMFTLSSVFAQSRKITGKVTDAQDGSPLPGVSVKVQGTSSGTQTDTQGSYSLDVSGGKALIFTYIGYSSQTVQIGSQSTLNLKLSSDAKALSEVVVTGYGLTQQKREVGGAISKISGSDFQNQPITSAQSALQGRVAGVSVTSNNGIPGGSIQVRVRGIGSFTNGTQPLYVVDGIQLSGDTYTAFTQSNTLAGINTNDIESIEVLKDAASASRYGAQGANGVVIITTKKGKAGDTKINFNYYTGRSRTIKTFNVLNSQDYIKLRTEAYTNANPTASAVAIRNTVVGEIGQPTAVTDDQLSALPSYDWQREAFHTGVVSNYELSANGGNDKTTFYVSGAYNTQQATITASDFKRGVFKLNLDHKATEKLSFNANLNLSTFKQRGPFSISGSFLGSPAFSASLILPTNPIYNDNGTFYGIPGSGQFFSGVLNQNIIENNAFNENNQVTNSLIGSFSANYSIIPSLQFKSFYSIEYRTVLSKNFRDPRTQDGFANKGSVEDLNDVRSNIVTDQTLSYDKVFNEDHKISALAGFEFRQLETQSIDEFGTGLPSPQFKDLSAAAVPVSVADFYTGYKTLSYLGSLNYSYKGRYSFASNIRYQGSSRFGTNHLFGLFGGVTAAWSIADEPFMKKYEWINELKLRAAVGTAGNDQGIGNFNSRALTGAGIIYNGSSGDQPISLANPDLQWERSTSYDLGLDFAFFKNRFFGSVGVYLKKNTQLLLNQPIISTSGYSSITTNVGAIENRGPEVELNTVNILTKNFKWSTNFNFSYNKNKVNQLYGGYDILPGIQSIRVGWDVRAIYTYRYAGVNSATGRPFWYDSNNNVTYSPNPTTDQSNVGTSVPKVQGGLTNTINFKGFDLNVLLQYSYGAKAFDSQLGFLYEDGRRSFNTLQDVFNRRWTTPGQITDIARPYNGGSESQGIASTNGTITIFKTDYIRMKEAQFGYTFPIQMLSKVKIRNLRIYAQATNLFTITKFPGYDPEFYDDVNNNSGTIPTSKNFTFGIQLGL